MISSEIARAYRIENREWLKSFEWIIRNESPQRAGEILRLLAEKAQKSGISLPAGMVTPYVNSLDPASESDYPGDLALEKELIGIIRWNAMAMVMRANQHNSGIGGHISTYSSAANLFEVGFNHFFKGGKPGEADQVYFQGHASPGIYARSYVERRFDEEMLENFRLEVQSPKGLSSYPHPRLMDDYWQFPTVSMGLASIQAIYHARFIKYLENREIRDKTAQRIWAFLGDGEMDEPESVGALSIAAREKLNNLIFVIDCNLQRLDGPVRGNGKIIQELEGIFMGAGWKVIKVLWGRDWDPLFERDKDDVLKEALNEVVDGQLQKLAAADGAYIRENFFGQNEKLKQLVEDFSDEELKCLHRGGHDPVKIFQAYKAAVENEAGPTVILAQTVKGYGQGEAGEASNVTHQQKKMSEDQLKYFRDRFKVPVKDDEIAEVPFYRPDKESEAYQYIKQHRDQLGGWLPQRSAGSGAIEMPDNKIFTRFYEGSGDKEVATTMVVVQLLSKLLKDENTGKLIVPVIPDESRTFGLDALFNQAGIYASDGQKYEPVDKGNLLYYKEEKKGVILEEGITEAGAMSTFIAAGTAYANHGIPAIPFFIFYSMFGFQRMGDLAWAAADARARGFLIGGISGRTSLSGEGLQHTDGQSHVYALAFPNLKAYDPAFAFEVAVIIREGIRQMYVENKDRMYYITVMNDTYKMPEMPEGDEVEQGIIDGMYLFRRSKEENQEKVNLLGSGAVMTEVLKAAQMLEDKFDISADVWSVTGYKQLYDNARDAERKNRLIQDMHVKVKCHIEKCVGKEEGIFIAACDYLKALPLSVANWFPGKFVALGTDGFGRSDTIPALRKFFEVDAKHIAFAALTALNEQGKLDRDKFLKYREDLEIDREKTDPADPL